MSITSIQDVRSEVNLGREYNTQVWRSHDTGFVDDIEAVLRRYSTHEHYSVL